MDTLILSDEIYEHLIYDGAVTKRCLLFGGPQGAYDNRPRVGQSLEYDGMATWIHAAPEPIAKKVAAIQSHSTSNPTSFAQKGGVAALTQPMDHLHGWLAEFSKRRAYAYQRLTVIPGMSCCQSKGAFYLFPKISEFGYSSSEFCERLLKEQNVAAVPGLAFGADGYFRLSYATSMEQLEKGLERIERFLRSAFLSLKASP